MSYVLYDKCHYFLNLEFYTIKRKKERNKNHGNRKNR